MVACTPPVSSDWDIHEKGLVYLISSTHGDLKHVKFNVQNWMNILKTMNRYFDVQLSYWTTTETLISFCLGSTFVLPKAAEPEKWNRGRKGVVHVDRQTLAPVGVQKNPISLYRVLNSCRIWPTVSRWSSIEWWAVQAAWLHQLMVMLVVGKSSAAEYPSQSATNPRPGHLWVISKNKVGSDTWWFLGILTRPIRCWYLNSILEIS